MKRYIHVFPEFVVFDEIFACYQAAASRLKWMSVAHWSAQYSDWQDPNNVIVLWWCNFPSLLREVPPQRKAVFAMRYMESIGPPEKLCPLQRAILESHLEYLKVPDLIIVGAPSTAQFLRPHCQNVVAIPIGYDPVVMGTPDWSAPKEYDFCFCGCVVGRREWIIPALKSRFGNRFVDVTGRFGLDRKAAYDRCRVALHIPHSEESYLSSERIWQFIASSAAMVTEKRDVWPAVAGRHYIELPEAQEKDVDKFIDSVEQALKLPLTDIARTAHEELSGYTVDRCLKEFMMPAVLDIPEPGR